jgi:hypothetical protein
MTYASFFFPSGSGLGFTPLQAPDNEVKIDADPHGGSKPPQSVIWLKLF